MKWAFSINKPAPSGKYRLWAVFLNSLYSKDFKNNQNKSKKIWKSDKASKVLSLSHVFKTKSDLLLILATFDSN